MNENTYTKLKINPNENLEEQNNNLLSNSYFSRHIFQLSYLAKFSRIVNGEKEVFKRWVKSDLNYNYLNQDVLNNLMQNLDDEQLEGSGFQFQEKEEVILEIYKVNDIQASSWVELPEKYKKNKSFINIQNNDQFSFFMVHFSPPSPG